MLHTNFRGNRPIGSGEEGFRRIFTIYGRGGHLGHVTKIMIFIFLYRKAFIQNLIQICIAVSEKIHFNFLCVHDLGPRSRNDIDLQYSYIFIYSIRYQLLLPFRLLAAIVGLPVPEKKIFEGFLPYMGMAAILVM